MIEQAILKINLNAKFTVYGTDIDTCIINWNNGTTPISKEDIKTKIAELQTAYNAKKYQRNRAAEYPSIADQLDDIYHNGIDGWKTTIKTTKDKYPKWVI